jgi:hypothetical protein
MLDVLEMASLSLDVLAGLQHVEQQASAVQGVVRAAGE